MTIVLQFELFSFPGASCLMRKRVEITAVPPIGTEVVVKRDMKAPLQSVTWDVNSGEMILRLNMGMVRDADRSLEELIPLGWTVARQEVWSQ